MAIKVITKNKRARSNNELLDKYEAGIVLQGWEIKSIRHHTPSIAEAYVFVKDGEAFLLNANIPVLANIGGKQDPQQTRKLLLKKSEIKKLSQFIQRDRLVLIPTKLYFLRSLVKLEFYTAKPIKKGDRREKEKEKEAQKEISKFV